MKEEEKAVTIIDPAPDRVLTTRERAILKLLMESYSMGEVAKKMHIGKTTLWATTSDPWFKRKLYEAQESVFNSTLALLAGQSRVFAETLLDVAQDTSEPGSTRISAARIALDKILALAESYEYRERIQALERTLEELIADLR